MREVGVWTFANLFDSLVAVHDGGGCLGEREGWRWEGAVRWWSGGEEEEFGGGGGGVCGELDWVAAGSAGWGGERGASRGGLSDCLLDS